ncbi:MAG TPA: hypothetical protein VGB89_11420 [Bacteroidota bacterium]
MKISILILAFTASALSQPIIKSSTVLPLPEEVQWFAPRFSPDGAAIYVTTSGYNGIWKYDIAAQSLQELTRDPGAGYEFAISADGNMIAFRRTFVHENGLERIQEIVRLDLAAGEEHVIVSAPTLSPPTLYGEEIVYRVGGSVAGQKKVESNASILLGIEKTKIVLLENGAKKIVDPISNGSYIWPVLSPDRNSLAGFETSKGLFISDVDGKNVRLLGRYNAPAWTHDGEWVVTMSDKDDGHEIISSDLVAVRVEGGEVIQLTSTDGIIELYPQCSPVDNRIVCATADGHVLLLTYSVENEK